MVAYIDLCVPMLGTRVLDEPFGGFDSGKGTPRRQYELVEFWKKVRSPSVCGMYDSPGFDTSALSCDLNPTIYISF